MLVASVEQLNDQNLEELRRFFHIHFEELSEHRGRFELNPQFGEYVRRQDAGQLLFVTLRDAGALCGYFVGFVTRGLHYADCVTLSPDIFYTLPEYRNGSPKAAIKLFREAEREARKRGVNLWLVGEKVKHRCDALFKFLGFEPFEVIHAKWLD